VSRRGIARRLKVGVSTLRAWERAGLLPKFGTVNVEAYADRIILIVAARRELGMERTRSALALGGC